MKNENGLQEKIVSFIKNADLYMENFEYVDMDDIKLDEVRSGEKPEEKILDIPDKNIAEEHCRNPI